MVFLKGTKETLQRKGWELELNIHVPKLSWTLKKDSRIQFWQLWKILVLFENIHVKMDGRVSEQTHFFKHFWLFARKKKRSY
jgi:hypothetical protein